MNDNIKWVDNTPDVVEKLQSCVRGATVERIEARGQSDLLKVLSECRVSVMSDFVAYVKKLNSRKRVTDADPLQSAKIASLEREVARLLSLLDTIDKLTSPPNAQTDCNDLGICPCCGGPADNGHDRGVPPSPYFCKRCTK